MKAAKSIKLIWPVQLLFDVAAIALSYWITFELRFASPVGSRIFDTINRLLRIDRRGEIGPELELFYVESAGRLIVILAVAICSLYACCNLYAGRRFLRQRPITMNIVIANGGALLIFYIYWYVTRNSFHPRSMFVTLIGINTVTTSLFRHLIEFRLHSAYRSGRATWRTLLFGTGQLADHLKQFIEIEHPLGISIVKELPLPDDDQMAINDLIKSVKESNADLVLCCDNSLTVPLIMRIIQATESLNVTVKVASEKLGVITYEARMPTDTIQGVPIVHFPPTQLSPVHAFLNRANSVFWAALVLIMLSPLWLLIAAAIRLSSKGPALYVQERIGFNRAPFRMYKFRTMHNQADEEQAELEELNESGEGLFKVRRDPRVTSIGQLLRRFSLDEVPQLINIVRGDMTLVGPRPLPRRDFEHYYEEWHYGRHGGLPGLTCIWQIAGRSEIDFRNMCLLDIYYLRNQNWILDIKLIARTVVAVLFGRGAY